MDTTNTPAEPQLGDPLPSTTDKIKQSCNRFRVLVLGKEGVGKSSLINHIFKVDVAKVSKYTAGEADITKEISSPENDSFVLHDSQGYGSGEVDNFSKLTRFISDRTGNANVGDQLHAIWLCISTPFAGGRVLEAGDKEIFRVAQRAKIPIIVVFTRYDYLVNKKEHELHKSGISRTEDEMRSLAKSNAYQSFDKDCITPMKKVDSTIPCVYVSIKPQYEETLRNVVKTTLHYINPGEHPLPEVTPTNHSESSKRPSRFRRILSSFKPSKQSGICETINPVDGVDTANSVSVMLATAQRIDVDAKIRESVSVGREKYWRGLASGVTFKGKDLRRCLGVIHDDILFVWNFRDLPMLYHDDFRGSLSKLVAGLADLDGPSPSDRIIQNTTNITGVVGAIAAVAAGTANPAGFIVGPIIAGTVFAIWVYGTYRATRGILQCFMAYIVDLTIIMQMIFVISEARPDGVVKTEEVENVLKRFETGQRVIIHRDIKQFVQQMGVLGAVVGKDLVFEKVVELIEHHRVQGEDSTRTEPPLP